MAHLVLVHPKPAPHKHGRNSARDYFRAHFPATVAHLEGEHTRAADVIEGYAVVNRERSAAHCLCLYCHALMYHAGAGIFVCPYECANVQELARAAYADAQGIGQPKPAAGPPEWNGPPHPSPAATNRRD